MQTRSPLRAYADFFESLCEATPIEAYRERFDENIYFEDPFQKVTGLAKVYAIFQHMFKTLHKPRFIVDEIISDKGSAYLRWTFSYQRSHKHPIEKFTGVSRVQLLENGKVLSHVDYWDAGENVYEKVPLLGSLLRLIKKKIRA